METREDIYSGFPPARSIAQAFEDPQIRHMGMRVNVKRGDDGLEIRGVRLSIRFSHSALGTNRPSLLLGEHQDRILLAIGLG